MPSVTDVQQQQQQLVSSNSLGKSTPPPTQPTTSTDSSNAEPLTQAILVLDKKQRNLGKRKEKLESYQEEARKGKELNKDQKDALAKYSDVLGQIECVKELNEQFKKIQTESARNQKRLSRQAAEEKRQTISQSLRQYAQIRYLLEHRPASVKPEESSLLDQLSTAVIPSDNSSDSISRSVDTVLSIYQNGPPSIIKSLTGKTPQEVREVLEELNKTFETQQQQQQQQQQPQEEEQPPVEEQPQIASSASEQEQEQEQAPVEELEQTNDIPSSNRTVTDYPLQFDTRSQKIPLEQIFQDTTFFSVDLNNQVAEEDNREPSPDPNQYLQTMTVTNSNLNDQPSSPTENQELTEQQSNRPRKNSRGNGSANQGGQYNNGNKNYNRRGSNNYYPQYRGGPRGAGRYDNSYGGGGGQRSYNEYGRGRGGYRGNRGGNYRPYNYNGNGYQNSAQYQNVHSAPPSEQQ